MVANGPLITIVGQTATGKTALALELAERLNGEIVCADSRTIYRELDIGTAKPTVSEQSRVPHHGLDVVSPDQSYNAAQFKQLAQEAIADIITRGRLPILVGGTGLYIDAVLYDYSFRAPADLAERGRLSGLSVEELQSLLVEQGIALPNNVRNPRHLMRALETSGAASQRQPLREQTLILGLRAERSVLLERISTRVQAMMAAGLETEARRAAERYGWTVPGLQAPAYRALRSYIDGTLPRAEALELFVHRDLMLAKRQLTWFKRNNSIQWLDNPSKAVEIATTFLNKI